MDLATATLLAGSLLQAAGALVLWTAGPGHRHRAMAALLAVNAFQPLPRAFGLPDAGAFSRVVSAIDALTVPLLFVAIGHRLGRARRPLIAAGSTLAAADAIVQVGLLDPSGVAHLALGSVPLYVAWSAFLLLTARSDDVDRWMCVAILPRATYFGAFAFTPFQPTFVEIASRSAQGVLLLACVVAVALVITQNGIWRPLAIAGAAMGISAQVASQTTMGVPLRITTVFDSTSLFLRALFLYVGFVRADVPSILSRTALSSVAALATTWLVEALTGPGPAAVAMGFGVGLVALALAETAKPRLWGRPVQDRSVAAPPEGPQWQRLLLALRGSSTGEAVFGWSQQGLAAATGISVKRVSDLPRDMERRAQTRLDRYLPGWRSETRTTPRLVEVREGVLPGAKGGRVYYRLTPWGERLAEALAAETVKTTVKEDVPAPESG